jgi:DNA repair protein RadC
MKQVSAMRHWPIADRPASRLLACGPAALADSEVLALLLPIAGKADAVTRARAMLTAHGSISAVCASPDAPATVRAAQELARRMLREELLSRDALCSPRAVRDYLRLSLGNMEHEVFCLLCLDAQHRVICYAELFRGTLTQTSVYPREVVKHALRQNAAAVIFAHNHPSGVAEPSHADEILTRSLKSALALVDVQVLDHFIIAGARTMSFAERGLL